MKFEILGKLYPITYNMVNNEAFRRGLKLEFESSRKLQQFLSDISNRDIEDPGIKEIDFGWCKCEPIIDANLDDGYRVVLNRNYFDKEEVMRILMSYINESNDIIVLHELKKAWTDEDTYQLSFGTGKSVFANIGFKIPIETKWGKIVIRQITEEIEIYDYNE